ncbi:Tetratricopeptide repeat protein 39B [Smittium culicis]|uniref:Tetratricopeptide repeat protein 39B n=1 Tax=Smittium culicis TaxID=133412 RepID=A0A1R1YU58_9FUNG|nr:Tetratricopeptide repeat protein 39B [Smittium culicis]
MNRNEELDLNGSSSEYASKFKIKLHKKIISSLKKNYSRIKDLGANSQSSQSSIPDLDYSDFNKKTRNFKVHSVALSSPSENIQMLNTESQYKYSSPPSIGSNVADFDYNSNIRSSFQSNNSAESSSIFNVALFKSNSIPISSSQSTEENVNRSQTRYSIASETRSSIFQINNSNHLNNGWFRNDFIEFPKSRPSNIYPRSHIDTSSPSKNERINFFQVRKNSLSFSKNNNTSRLSSTTSLQVENRNRGNTSTTSLYSSNFDTNTKIYNPKPTTNKKPELESNNISSESFYIVIDDPKPKNFKNDKIIAAKSLLNNSKHELNHSTKSKSQESHYFAPIVNPEPIPIDTNPILAQHDISLYNSKYALSLFLNSRYNESEKLLLENTKNNDLYSSEGYATIAFIKSAVSFDRELLKDALKACTDLVNLATQIKNSSAANNSSNKEIEQSNESVVGWLKYSYSKVANISIIKSQLSTFLRISEMDPLQRNAELICAEAYLLRAVSNVILNEGLVSFLKESWNVKTAYFIYKNCVGYVSWCNEKGSPEAIEALKNLDSNFISGVLLGAGVFNVVLSMLPPKLLKIFEYVGFSANLQRGLELLKKSARINPNLKDEYSNESITFQTDNSLSRSSSIESFKTANQFIIFDDSELPRTNSEDLSDYAGSSNCSMRSELSALTLIAYHTLLCPETGNDKFDLEFARSLISYKSKVFSKSVILMYFAGKIHELRTELDESIRYYKMIRNIKFDPSTSWYKMSHLGIWEISCCFMAKGNWADAYEGFDILYKESDWSKAVIRYCSAICYYEEYLENNDPDTFLKVTSMLSEIPGLKKKIAGKSIAIEKFVIRKSRKFFTQEKFLLLPSLELLLVLNFIDKMPSERLKYLLEKKVNKQLSSSLANSTPINEEISDETISIDNEAKKMMYGRRIELNEIPIEILARCWANESLYHKNMHGNDNKIKNSKITNNNFNLVDSNFSNYNKYKHLYYEDDLALILLLQSVIHFNLAFPFASRNSINSSLTENQINHSNLSRKASIRLLRITSKVKLDHYLLVYGRLTLATNFLYLGKSRVARLHLNAILDSHSFSSRPELLPPNNNNKINGNTDDTSKSSRLSLNPNVFNNKNRLSSIFNGYSKKNSVDVDSSTSSKSQLDTQDIDNPLFLDTETYLQIKSLFIYYKGMVSKYKNPSYTNLLSETISSNPTVKSSLFSENELPYPELLLSDPDTFYGWTKSNNIKAYSMRNKIDTFSHNRLKSIQ